MLLVQLSSWLNGFGAHRLCGAEGRAGPLPSVGPAGACCCVLGAGGRRHSCSSDHEQRRGVLWRPPACACAQRQPQPLPLPTLAHPTLHTPAAGPGHPDDHGGALCGGVRPQPRHLLCTPQAAPAAGESAPACAPRRRSARMPHAAVSGRQARVSGSGPPACGARPGRRRWPAACCVNDALPGCMPAPPLPLAPTPPPGTGADGAGGRGAQPWRVGPAAGGAAHRVHARLRAAVRLRGRGGGVAGEVGENAAGGGAARAWPPCAAAPHHCARSPSSLATRPPQLPRVLCHRRGLQGAGERDLVHGPAAPRGRAARLGGRARPGGPAPAGARSRRPTLACAHRPCWRQLRSPWRRDLARRAGPCGAPVCRPARPVPGCSVTLPQRRAAPFCSAGATPLPLQGPPPASPPHD